MLVPLAIVLVGAWTYRWVDEDAFINFRIIHNLLAGHGPVFNVGERVEVDSDPLWMFTLALVHAVTPWASLEWTSVVLGLICTAGGFVAGRASAMTGGAAVKADGKTICSGRGTDSVRRKSRDLAFNGAKRWVKSPTVSALP